MGGSWGATASAPASRPCAALAHNAPGAPGEGRGDAAITRVGVKGHVGVDQ